ncbi:actin-like ATPase domain-containing protein [Thozetella sp. PMI_491]|nr:actin-like ATPase domain-containing protein [Thozetella sp. PMI_491]
MVGKVSERVLLREGLERTDNGMKQSSWPDVAPINQKNYYTDYMKRDDQILSLRLQNEANRDRLVQNAKDRDRALNNTNGEVPLPLDLEDNAEPAPILDPSKIIVIHPGSQNLRIGLASDALPKTIPMTLATRFSHTEEESNEALPRRKFEGKTPDEQYGEEWAKKFQKMSNDLKVEMRTKKLRVLPNSKELVVNYNRRHEPEVIPTHNDPLQIEWTDIHNKDDPAAKAACFIGNQALRIPDDSNPKFKLWWPLQSGWLNEADADYQTAEQLYNDFQTLLDIAIRQELGLTQSSQWRQYSCVFIIPDLYDKKYVEQALHACINHFDFHKVSFIQESLAATFGAGYTQACVVDVGAQKTSITCVEDGLCLEDSRINLKFGGYDVTETFMKMMLYDHFPYEEINLRRRYDFLLAEELKIKCCNVSQGSVAVENPNFHLRAPNQPTRKYQFKMFDEMYLAPWGLFDPSIFDHSAKLKRRRQVVERSYNAYDADQPDDPSSMAQLAILELIQPSVPTATNGVGNVGPSEMATPSKEKSQPFNFLARPEINGTPATSNAPSPAPEGASTPVPAPYVFNAGSPAPNARNGGTPGPPNGVTNGAPQPPPGIFVEHTAKSIAAEQDKILPIAPVDIAIMTSIQNAAKGDDKKVRDLLGSIMVIGGGAKIPNFTQVLEEKLRARRPDLFDRILVSRSARDMDEQVVVWKGASVFAKLPTNDSWITCHEYEMFGSRAIYGKALWYY